MSNMYAIKEDTLTALGDAVRNKVNGTTELPLPISKENVSGGPYNEEVVEFPDFVKTIKVMGHIYDVDISDLDPQGILHNLAYASGVYTDSNDVRKASDFTAINPNWAGVGYDFEITVKSNALTFTTEKNYNSWQMTFVYDYTAVGLDENGNEFKYTPLEMVNTINGLDTIPDTALKITGFCGYKFSGDGWNWLIEQVGNKITTNNISNAQYMFSDSISLENIPFEINLKKDASLTYMFNNCQKLKAIPQVNIPAPSTHVAFTYLFNNCYCIRELPDWVGDFFENDYNIGTANTTFAPYQSVFSSCWSLRSIPDKVMKYIANPKLNGYYYGVAYSRPFTAMYALDELLNIHCDEYNYTSNQFSNFFQYLAHAKNITFATNEDGSPVIRAWANQLLDLTAYIGYVRNKESLIDYNSGITADKEVKDDATYQALKNDPDWFSCDINYSRYNHDSAVNTINSLPDCSATGTNTIKFSGMSGALTDGGAINTLTEEEIAVAAARGWTVTLS